ncbi:Histidine kinase [Paenibacillus sp. UNCCL117]|uniref:sensor histidine kinase n=1 Tax=unclassified Paenibacillus TaxID=185978 RepID=UPI00088176DF|nr:MULTISPECIES: sensor histidine kinase [unclassified Paenibacillus]SDE12383.1 Histidine kinase [Paenibacillus sp. cl123]SFW60169.1 Histidine kinase [Paenibacillus sp. UNCCL117]
MKGVQPLPNLQPSDMSSSHHPRWLFVLYSGSVALVLFLIVFYLASLPFFYEYLSHTCYSGQAGKCMEAGISVMPVEWSGAAALHVGINMFLFSCYALVAAFILLLKPLDKVGSIAAFTLVAFAFGDLVVKLWEGSEILVHIAQVASMVGLTGFALLFPSGRVTRKWLAWTAGLALAARNLPDYVPYPVVHIDNWPLGLSLCWLVVFYGALAYSQITQYRENAAQKARQAIRKVAYGFVGAFLGLISVNLLLLIWPQLYKSDIYWLDLTIRLVMLPIPISLGAALLKHRLWGVPPVVRRTFVYAALLVVLFGIYMATVWYLALVFRTESRIFSLIATGVVAVLFAPLKAVMETFINRIVYGKRGNPVEFLIGLGDRLAEPYMPEKVLGSVVATIKEMLQLPYASVTILVNGSEREAAAAGMPNDMRPVRFPLVMGGEELGSLYVSPRSPDEPLTSADLKQLRLLVRESSRIVQGLKQSLDIGRLMQELQASREKLIFAREEERRSIRNNLHDDLAPRLASLALSASAAGAFMSKSPQRAAAIVSELETDIRAIVADIREFVHNLRPPALDQYGLVEAIRQLAGRFMRLGKTQGGGDPKRIKMEVTAPGSLPVLPAAVEVAAYRIVSEAMVNAFKHSQAGLCRVTLDIRAGSHSEELYVEIMDDGVGIAASNKRKASGQESGVGLISLRERAAELGGRSSIEPAEGGGTRISAWLPLSLSADWRAAE